MMVRVKLFAVLRERAGSDEVMLDLPDGASVRDARAALRALVADCPVVLAVNRVYATDDVVLHGGDEVALVPPVSGGASAAHVAVRTEPLSLEVVRAAVRSPRAGAVVVFEGVTRDVAFLDYEVYAEMAVAEMRGVVERAIAAHGLCAAAAEHRVGRVALSEPSVIVAASAPHRAQAFAGARMLIDEIKERAPIWKREEGTWVEGTVPS